MQIKIIREGEHACVGTTACIDLAPEAYELDKEGIAKIKDGFEIAKATEEQKKKILEGAMSCPQRAIIVVDDNGKQIWPEAGK